MKKYIELLSNTFMLRALPPLVPNRAKRVVKSPKIHLRDSGILHALLRIDSFDDLLGHPALGPSWEALVIENVIAAAPGWEPHFYRTSNGAEIDLVLERGRKKIAVECKASAAPQVTRGFWNAVEDLDVQKAWVIAPVQDAYPIGPNTTVAPLRDFGV